VKDAGYEARQKRRDRERQAGEAFQEILRKKREAPLRVENLMGRGEPDGGRDDAA
jgi:hypothetical protein